MFFGSPRPATTSRAPTPLEDPAQYGVDPPKDRPEQIGPYTLIPSLELFPRAQELQALVLDVPGQGVIQVVTVSTARLVTATQRYTYDAEQDVLIDNATGTVCPPVEGNFVCDGQAGTSRVGTTSSGSPTSAPRSTDPRLRVPLVQVFIWTVVFAALTVTFSLALGMLLAIALNDQRLRGKRALSLAADPPLRHARVHQHHRLAGSLQPAVRQGERVARPDTRNLRRVVTTVAGRSLLGEGRHPGGQHLAHLSLHVPDHDRGAHRYPRRVARGGAESTGLAPRRSFAGSPSHC